MSRKQLKKHGVVKMSVNANCNSFPYIASSLKVEIAKTFKDKFAK